MHVITEEKLRIRTDWHAMVIGSKARLICLTLFFVAIASTYVQWYPHNYRSFKTEDSGLFLHIGQRLLHGDVLYRDIADNKPPLIYWLNELGLLLGHGSPSGVFFLCLLAGMLIFAILYLGLRRYVGWQLFIVAGCLAQLEIIQCALHPNYTEFFALPLVTLAAVLFVRALLDSENPMWHALVQGALASLLFCLRPNNIGISFIYFLYLLLDMRRSGRFRQLGLFAIGATTAYGLVLLPLALQGVVSDYVTYVFRMAGPYTSGTTMIARLRALWGGISLFNTSPLLYFSLACAATVILTRRHHRQARVLFWLVTWFVLETILSSTSGYHWDHYYLLWILPLAIIMMVSGSVLFEGQFNPLLPVLLAVSLIVAMLSQATIFAIRTQTYPRKEDPAVALARPYAHKDDRVSTWGYFFHDLWFDMDRRPGSRWFHEGAYTNQKIYRALLPIFLGDLEHNRPRIVIERRSALPLFAPADLKQPLNDAFPATYFAGWDDADILKRKAALAQNYYQVAEKSGIVVYLRRER